MKTWVNYKEIKARVNIGQVLEHYGVLGTLREKGDELIGCCPIHHGTNANQFHASRTKNNFMCFGNCHGGGNVIDFVVLMEGGDKDNGDDVRAAAIRMQEWFGLTFERPRGGRRTATASAPATATASATTSAAAEEHVAAPQQTLPMTKTRDGSTPAAEPGPAPLTAEAPATQDPPSLPVSNTTGETTPETAKVNPPLKFTLKSLDPAHPYLTERGFTAETIAHFGVGLCTGKGIMAGRIAIPIHNEQGELVAYAGRWPGDPPDGEGKYKLPAGFHKSSVVYNLHRAEDQAKDQGLIVVEGFFDCMRLHQAGMPNVVALMGSSLSDEQEALIVAAVGPHGKVALMFDEDEAGWKGRQDALSRLSIRVHVKVVELGEEGTQPDSLSPESVARYLGGL
jgi:DNA primase